MRVARDFCWRSSSLIWPALPRLAATTPGPRAPDAQAGLERLESRRASRPPVAASVSSCGGADEVVGGVEAGGQRHQRQRDVEHRLAGQPGVLVAGQPARPADVAAGGAGRPGGERGVHAVPADQHVGDRVDRRRPQPDHPAARSGW